MTPSLENRRKIISDLVASGQIDSNVKLEHAFEYLEKNTSKPELDLVEFKKVAGVGGYKNIYNKGYHN